jgi:NAD(P)-dependent dehydrogenase (short-subunit alcohol dehydrogenase family)
MSDKKLGGVALVTGAGRGLGRAFALGLAGSGMRVAAVARSADQVGETVRLIEEAGGTALALAADISDPAQVAGTARTVRERLGEVDLLVNNAGSSGPIGPGWEVDRGEWWRCFEVNVRGAFLCCGETVPGMVARGSGRIVNVASGAGTIGIPYISAYVSSKAALIRFSETLGAELKSAGVRVFSIQPGTVRTAMAEQVLRSPEKMRWMPWFQKIFDAGEDVSTDPATALVLYLASGAADELSGRFFIVPDDPARVVEHAQRIHEEDLYLLRMRTLSSRES